MVVCEGAFMGLSEDEDDVDVVRIQIDEDKLYAIHGGVPTITGVYTREWFLTVRRRLLALILEVAISRVQFEGNVQFWASELAPWGIASE